MRRWIGACALGLALVMLALGSTVLEGRLSAPAFLLYWLVCFVCTVAAIFVAVADAAATRRRLRQDQRALLESTLETIRREAKNRSRKSFRD